MTPQFVPPMRSLLLPFRAEAHLSARAPTLFVDEESADNFHPPARSHAPHPLLELGAWSLKTQDFLVARIQTKVRV